MRDTATVAAAHSPTSAASIAGELVELRCPMRVPRPWALITDPTLSQDMSDPIEADDPMQKADPAEFTDPMLSADPTDPMLSTEPWEAMLSIDPSDQRDHLDATTHASWQDTRVGLKRETGIHGDQDVPAQVALRVSAPRQGTSEEPCKPLDSRAAWPTAS